MENKEGSNNIAKCNFIIAQEKMQPAAITDMSTSNIIECIFNNGSMGNINQMHNISNT